MGNQMGALFSASGAVRAIYGPVPTGHISVLTADGIPDVIGSAVYDNPGGVIYGLAGLG